MKKLGMLGIIGGAALLTAAPLSLQWSQKNVALSLDSAEAQSGPRAIGPPFSLSSPTSCGYIPYGTSYAAPCGYYSSSYAQAYERLARLLVPVRRGAGDGAARGNLHQFSPVFTSSWAAVEVNAVQTKCEFYWGAIADSKGRHDR